MPGDYYPTGPFIGKGGRDEDFERAREDFLLSYRERTARAYKSDLQHFWEWCDARGLPLNEVRSDVLVDYAEELTGQGFSQSTIARRTYTVRRFLRHLRGPSDASS